MIYPFQKILKLGTNQIYLQSVELAEAFQNTYLGIKEKCFLTNYINIPDQIPLDYMHLTALGTVKSMISYWIISKNHNEEYYLGKFKRTLNHSKIELNLI